MPCLQTPIQNSPVEGAEGGAITGLKSKAYYILAQHMQNKQRIFFTECGWSELAFLHSTWYLVILSLGSQSSSGVNKAPCMLPFLQVWQESVYTEAV